MGRLILRIYFLMTFASLNNLCISLTSLDTAKMKIGAFLLLAGAMGVTAEEKDTAFLAVHDNGLSSSHLTEESHDIFSAEVHQEHSLDHHEHDHDEHSEEKKEIMGEDEEDEDTAADPRELKKGKKKSSCGSLPAPRNVIFSSPPVVKKFSNTLSLETNDSVYVHRSRAEKTSPCASKC